MITGIKQTLVLLVVLMPVVAFGKTFEIQMRNQVEGQSMVFVPSYIHIEVGDTVVFVPTDDGHNSHSVFTPEKAPSWQGETSQKTQVTLTKEGVYIFECTNHAIMGMVGVIQVGKALNLDAAKKFQTTFEKKFITNKNRLSQSLANIQ
ncbi:MAG: pseudoazurin [Bdellovibrionales bacterium]|nr:pseudoazurin [Bdellovibrionales bacterium]